MKTKYNQLGMGMTEVLVAMLLLGIGVIGFAALQVKALSASHDSAFRTQASSIAKDVLERMHVNPTASAIYTNNSLWDAPTVNRDACEIASCNTTTALANYDIADIANMAQTTLPSGRVNVRACEGGRSNICVYVSWNATTPTVGPSSPNCVVTGTGLYVSATLPKTTDCLVSEGG
jgi:type IV pilus assembly protein PilV